jgi:NTP pyrophosphatase (non-canonical NTP hydrolase)
MSNQEARLTINDLGDLTVALRSFAIERDWDQFHTPKNLAAALSVEAGEVLEHLLWVTGEQSMALQSETRDAIALELADVLLYLLRLSDKLGIDVVESAKRKLVINAQKYPVDRARGSSKKYTDL